MVEVQNGRAYASSQEPRVARIWAAVAGRWRFDDSKATFEGPDTENATIPLGLAVCEQRFRDGYVHATVRLTRNSKTTAGIILGYQSADLGYFAVTLGSHDRAYSISEFVPGRGWSALVGAGNLSNLEADRPYHLEVTVSGQSLSFSVDGVHVISHILRRPIEGTGLGLHAWGDAAVRFEGLTVEGQHPHVFVIMPFSEPYDTVYREVIEPVARDEGFRVVRVDEIHGPGLILEDIQQEISRSHAVIAEVSSHNPNVFYELGYAHALGKPAVLLVRRQEDKPMPFDIHAFRAIFYDDSIGGKRVVERRLREHLRAILRGTLVSQEVA